MARNIPTIVRHSLGASGRLSVLISDLELNEADNSTAVLLHEVGAKSHDRPMDFVRTVQEMSHYQAGLEAGKRYNVVAVSPLGQRHQLRISKDFDSKRSANRKSWLRNLLRAISPKPQYFQFEPAVQSFVPKIETNHDSVSLSLADSKGLMLSARKFSADIKPHFSDKDNVNVFSHREFGDVLVRLPDGSSSWDFYIQGASKRRLSFWGADRANARNDYKYPWFWMSDSRFSAKARLYWTVDGNLAMKVIKKGIR